MGIEQLHRAREDDETFEVLSEILKELKKVNFYLGAISDMPYSEEISNDDD